MKCHYCDETDDLRPYGPRGAMVCFDCAMGAPERKLEAELAFAVQLGAAGPVAVIDGSSVGPYPIEHNPEAVRALRAAIDAVEEGAVCRSDGRCRYAIDHGAEGLGHCQRGKCVMKEPS